MIRRYSYGVPVGIGQLLTWIRRKSEWFVFLIGLGNTIVSGLVKVTKIPTWWPETWNGFFPWMNENQVLVISIPFILLFLLQRFNGWVDRREAERKEEFRLKDRNAKLKELLSRLLERVRLEFIPQSLHEAPKPHHRLTVFKANEEQTCLEIFARSSEATRTSSTSWEIHPDIESKCEGVAGMAWFRDHWVIVPGPESPELPAVGNGANDERIADYARRTWVSEEVVRKKCWQARSFAAITIRVNGRRWGVLVLDSADPRGADDQLVRRKGPTVEMFGQLIEAWIET